MIFDSLTYFNLFFVKLRVNPWEILLKIHI